MYGEKNSVVPGNFKEDVYNVGAINLDEIPIFPTEVIQQFETITLNLTQELDLIGNPMEKGFGKFFIDNIHKSQRLTDKSNPFQFNVIHFDNINNAKIATQSQDIALCFIIPTDFSKTLFAGINYYTKITTGKTITDDPDLINRTTTIRMIGDFSYSRFAEASTLLDKMLEKFLTGYSKTTLPGGYFETVTRQISSQHFTKFDVMVPGFLVFVLLMSISGSTAILTFERTSGMLDRLNLADYRPSNLIIGLAITQVVTTALQILVFFISIYLVGFPGPGNPVYAFIASLIVIIPIFGLGLLVAALCTDEKTATGLPGLIAVPISFLSGAWIPLSRWPLFGKIQVWHLNPMFSASEAFRKILLNGLTLEDVFLELFFAALIGIFIFLLGSLLFRNRAYQTSP